jgi:nucleoside-diphosphate-sugar epimerase
MSLKNIIVIGYGYVGEHVVKLELGDRHKAFALTRSSEKAAKLTDRGINGFVGDLDDKCKLDQLPISGAGVYYFAPPPSSGSQDTRIRNFLGSLNEAKPPECVVYISTTGVYGNPGHEKLTDENSPTEPAQERAQRRLDAENALLEWNEKHPQTRVVILRVVGIYGPDKLPLERIKRGEPLLDEKYPAYVNLIHIDDLAQACYQALRSGKSKQIYNVSDGHPILMTRYFQAIAEQFNLPQPPLISLEEAKERLTPGFLSYLKESKRIDNTKMLKELGVRLKYPNAIKAIFSTKNTKITN